MSAVEIYPMPSFPVLEVADPAASAAWYRDALGFTHVFTMGPAERPTLVHLRWTRFADLLLRQGAAHDAPKGRGVVLNFAVFEGGVDAVAERAARHGARIVTPPGNRPWNARDFTVEDPDGFRLTFTMGPVDPGPGIDEVAARAGG